MKKRWAGKQVYTKSPKHKRRLDIFVDIDGTLIKGGELNKSLASYLEECKAQGCKLYLWSARGVEYVSMIAKEHGVTSMFEALLPKPGYVVDDLSFQWAQDIKIISPNIGDCVGNLTQGKGKDCSAACNCENVEIKR